MTVCGLVKRLGHLLCRLGLHDWGEFVYNHWNYLLFRRCQRCGKEDRREQ